MRNLLLVLAAFGIGLMCGKFIYKDNISFDFFSEPEYTCSYNDYSEELLPISDSNTYTEKELKKYQEGDSIMGMKIVRLFPFPDAYSMFVQSTTNHSILIKCEKNK